MSDARISELEKLIRDYSDAYYNAEALISDEEFDALYDELARLDPAHPLLSSVGSDSGNFPKVRHRIPMGSQDKAASEDAFRAWALKRSYEEYLVEYKMDGASLELQYDRGVLVRAVTRGDGEIGDDITPNALKMQGIITEIKNPGELIPIPYSGGVRGEVIMTKRVHRSYFSDKANCRNAANGLMRRKDGEGCQYLQVVCYDAWFDDEGALFSDEEAKIAWLSSVGFTVVPLAVCASVDAVIAYRAEVAAKRDTLDFDIDGLVIKERHIDKDDARRAKPERQIAFKFGLEQAVSTLRSVEWSESGTTYTPIAHFDPVELAGTTVRRASLVNPNTMRSLGIKIGSRVVVTKRGEIIPKIEAALPAEGETADIEWPTVCSHCNTPLIDEGSRLYCPHTACPKRILHRLHKWVRVLDIRDLGEGLLDSLFASGRVRSISDLYRLTEQDLAPFFLNEESLAKEKESRGAKKAVRAIQSHREMNLSEFIAGFDIDGLGKTMAEKLEQAGFLSLESLLNAEKEAFLTVPGFADILADNLIEGLKEHRAEMEALASSVLTIRSKNAGAQAGLSFCFTGELSIKRSEAQRLVEAAGGTVKTSVVKGLSYLVTNDTESGSAKNKKAAALGIPVIDEKAFLSLIGKT